MIPTVKLTIELTQFTGSPLADTTISLQLSTSEFYGGIIVNKSYTGKTDDNGKIVLDVFPNELGTRGSHYNLSVTTRNSFGGLTWNVYKAVVPNRDVSWNEIAENDPFPPTEMPKLLGLETRILALEQGGGGGGGDFTIDTQTLKFVNGKLFVNTTDSMEANKQQPITSHGVALQVGNINSLLVTI